MTRLFLNQRIGGSTNAILADMLDGIAFVGAEEQRTLVFGGSNGLVLEVQVAALSMVDGEPTDGIISNMQIFWNGQLILGGTFDRQVRVFELYPALVAAGTGNYAAIDAFFASLTFTMQGEAATSSISFVTGAQNDALFGSAFDDYLDGGAGDDVFMGFEGSDQIVGGDGYDRIDLGGSGSWGGFVIDMSAGTVTSTYYGDVDHISGIEHITGSMHVDTFIGDDQANAYQTNFGGDQVHMGKGIDILFVPGTESLPNYAMDLVAGTATGDLNSIITFSGLEYFSFADVFLELEEHTVFGGTMSADLLAADLSSGALRFWDADLAGPVQIAALGNRHVIGMGNFAGDLTDDAVYRTDSGWYGLIDSNGTNVNIGYRNGQSLLAIGDFSGDGRDDLLFENDSTGHLSLVRGGTNLTNANIGARAGQTLVAVGDFNGDAKDDMLFRSDSSGWLSYARGGDFANVNVGFRAGQDILAVGDFDGNGRDDILFRSIESGWLSYARDGNGANVNVGYKAGQDVLGAGDFNDDGATDVLAMSASGWLSYTDGKTGANVNVGFAHGRTLISIGDYDGDGASDLLFQHNSTKVVSFMSAANAADTVVLGNLTGQDILSGDFGTNMGDDMLIA